jgi:hypothetical protein
MISALAQKLSQEKFSEVIADREMQFVKKVTNSIKETLYIMHEIE